MKETSPAAVVVVDALAAGDPSRLGATVQVCDTGISPGSGVANRRKELSRQTLGVPVVAVGVPTVVDYPLELSLIHIWLRKTACSSSKRQMREQ